MADNELDRLVQLLLSRQITTGRASIRQQPEGLKGIQMGREMGVLNLGSPTKVEEDYARREKQLNQARDMLRAMHGPDRDLVVREMLELKARREAGTK